MSSKSAAEKIVMTSAPVAGGAFLGTALGGPIGLLIGVALGAGAAALASSDRYSRTDQNDTSSDQDANRTSSSDAAACH